MKVLMAVFLILSVVCKSAAAFAQTDTIAQHLQEGTLAGHRDASYTKKIFHQNNEWHRRDYWDFNGRLKLDGYYEDSLLTLKNGVFTSFTSAGDLDDSAYFYHGKEVYSFWFYPHHLLKAFAYFGRNDTIIKQGGWDETGKPIQGYIYQQPAEFAGGTDEWQHYIIVELQKNLPRAFRKGEIWGDVVISFLVLADGTISDIKVDKTSGYPELDYHAVNLIKNSPQWLPAIQFNKTVAERKTQLLTYVRQQPL